MVQVKGQQRETERKQNPINYKIYPMTSQ